MKFELGIGICVVGLITSIIVLQIGEHNYSKQVVKEDQAGIAITATFHPQNPSTGESTTVETDKGVYTVEGVFQLVKGHQLSILTMKNGDYRLNDKTTQISNKLMQDD